jgi:hypothetical protein
MANLEAEIPQDIEHEFDGRLAPGGGFCRLEEEQIDIRTRRQRTATIAADGGDGDAAGRRGLAGAEDVVEREIVQDGDQLVLQPGNTGGALQTAAIGKEQFARSLTAGRIDLLELGEKLAPHPVAVIGIGACDEFTSGAQCRHVEKAGIGRCQKLMFHRMPACVPLVFHRPFGSHAL